MLGVRPSLPASRSTYTRLTSSSPTPASSSLSSPSLCSACSELPGTDRIVIFLVVVVLVWLGGIAFYLQSEQTLGLRPHRHAMVNSAHHGSLTAIVHEPTFSGAADTTTATAEPVAVPVQHVSIDTSAATAAAGEPSSWSALPNAAILVMTYNRPTYLQRALEHIVNASGFPHFKLYVSQDGNNPDLAPLLQPFITEQNLTYMHRMPRTPLASPTQGGTAYLAQHYKCQLIFQHSLAVWYGLTCT